VKTELIRQLKGDEGVITHAYPDHLGYLTIGVGRLIDERKGGGLRPDEITYLLNNDVDDRIGALTKALPWFQDLDDARKGVLLNMSFQMGTDGLLQFRRTLDHIRLGKYIEAADAMLQSLWAKQTPERAQRLAKQMLTGIWQYAE
jgi:lysozyme